MPERSQAHVKHEGPVHGNWWIAAGVLFASGPLLLVVFALSRAWMNHDAAWYLHMAGVWLDGGALYRDVVDTNPPLIVWLTAAVVAAARAAGASSTTGFQAVVLLGGILAAVGGARIAARVVDGPWARPVVQGALICLLLPFAGADFGQREHLATLLVMPYVLAAGAASAGRPLSTRMDLGLGILAGIGFAVKPHFVLAWLTIELAMLVAPGGAGRRVRAAAWPVLAVWAGYAAAVLLWAPQYLDVARDVARVYGGLNESAARLLRLPDVTVWLAALAVAAVLSRTGSIGWGWLPVFGAATGFLAAALVQRKGWAYHLYPFRVFAGLFFTFVFVAGSEAVLRRRRVFGSLAAITALAVMLLVSYRSAREMIRPSGIEQAVALRSVLDREEADALAVLSMRTLIFPAFPVVNYTGVPWVLGHNSLWFLPGLYADALPEGQTSIPFRRLTDMDPLERGWFDRIVDDLCRHPPALLVIEPPPAVLRGGFGSLDLVGYYRQDARFAGLFRGYTEVERFGPFSAYRRQPGASCALPGAR